MCMTVQKAILQYMAPRGSRFKCLCNLYHVKTKDSVFNIRRHGLFMIQVGSYKNLRELPGWLHHFETGVWMEYQPCVIIWHISLFSSSKLNFTFLLWWCILWWEHKHWSYAFILQPVLKRNNAAICRFYCSILRWPITLLSSSPAHHSQSKWINLWKGGLIINCIVAWCPVQNCRLRSDTNLLVIDSVAAIWSLIHFKSAVNHIPAIRVLYYLWDILLSFAWNQMHLFEVANRDKLTHIFWILDCE